MNNILAILLETNLAPALVALAAVLAVFGAAWGIGGIGKSAMDSIARQPEATDGIRASMMIACALIEGATLFAIVVCILAVLK